MLTLISGGPLQVGFVDTQGQAFIDILHSGDMTIFSRGTLDFELNVGIEEANYISALNSQNPGVVTSSVSILKLPLRSVSTAFNITQQAVGPEDKGFQEVKPNCRDLTSVALLKNGYESKFTEEQPSRISESHIRQLSFKCRNFGPSRHTEHPEREAGEKVQERQKKKLQLVVDLILVILQLR
ncbi:hypothetical protein SUGI_0754440 [Cryptomeria japonica]|nr:hypothetical protein SUGI_0754440 [Cryptomeria japonica]